MLTEKNTICIASPKYRVMSDDMMILNDLVSKYNWKDVEVFGQGDMIGSLVVANHWTLTPADYYQYSIPIEAMQRIYLAHKAGVQIKGVVIADDERKWAAAAEAHQQSARSGKDRKPRPLDSTESRRLGTAGL